MSTSQIQIGRVTRVAGTVVFATGFETQSKNIIVRIGSDQILGEVVQVREQTLVIQAYEDTEGVKVGDTVLNTNEPFKAVLGPGMLGTTFDGLQRPTKALVEAQGPFLSRGTQIDPIDHSIQWQFRPVISAGAQIKAGDILGYVREYQLDIPIKLGQDIAPQRLRTIVAAGTYSADSIIATLADGTQVGLYQQWEIRADRPNRRRLETITPLVTGQRVIDTLFPVMQGGTATVSGGFGTGKTILEQSLAKFARVDIIVFVLIGERGNEVSTVLGEFSELKDDTGNSLLNRTVVIANTSNMPVAAREASMFLGMTIAEFFSDLGFNVALLADSMSRWAEAVREISGRLEEMPAEEGYPAYMSKSFGEFFERAGRFETHSGDTGSITYIAAISPPGGDFTEPVTQAALRVTGSFWALSTELARSRHFPAVDWNVSFSQYGDQISAIETETFKDWGRIRKSMLVLLKKEEELQQTVRLLGRDNLSEQQKGILDLSTFIREAYLHQDSFDHVDQDCSLEKQYAMLLIIDKIHQWMLSALKQGLSSSDFFEDHLIKIATRMHEIDEHELYQLSDLAERIEQKIGD